MVDTLTKTKGNPRSVRFSNAPWFHPGISVIIAGIGGIGSWLSFFLARQECILYIHEIDSVDETNLGGQLYGTNYIGTNKIQAMTEIIENFSNNKNVHNMGKFDADSFASPIMFSCFDNMEGRKLMFEKWREQNNRAIFIDGRLLAESGQILAVTKGNEELYKKELFDDSEVEDLDCSMKATSHCGAMIASYMVAIFNNFVANKKTKMDMREVPFKTLFELPTITQYVKV